MTETTLGSKYLRTPIDVISCSIDLAEWVIVFRSSYIGFVLHDEFTQECCEASQSPWVPSVAVYYAQEAWKVFAVFSWGHLLDWRYRSVIRFNSILGTLLSDEANFLTLKLHFVFVEFDFSLPETDYKVYHNSTVFFLCSYTRDYQVSYTNVSSATECRWLLTGLLVVSPSASGTHLAIQQGLRGVKRYLPNWVGTGFIWCYMSVAFLCMNFTKEFGTTKLCDYFINYFSVVMFTLYCLVLVAWVEPTEESKVYQITRMVCGKYGGMS